MCLFRRYLSEGGGGGSSFSSFLFSSLLVSTLLRVPSSLASYPTRLSHSRTAALTGRRTTTTTTTRPRFRFLSLRVYRDENGPGLDGTSVTNDPDSRRRLFLRRSTALVPQRADDLFLLRSPSPPSSSLAPSSDGARANAGEAASITALSRAPSRALLLKTYESSTNLDST